MFDVIIVGGGVAGSYLASQIKQDCNVLVIERNKKIMPKDSGIVSTEFDKIFGKKGRNLIKCKIDRMDCVSASGLVYPLQYDKPFAYILKRRKFSKFLRKKGTKNADILYDCVNGISFEDEHVIVKTEANEFRTKVVVGCDGASSVVRNFMGIEQPKLALGIMIKTKQNLEGDINVFFNKYFSPDFFAWIIPQNNEYGMMTAIRPADYFNYFVKNMYLPPGRMYAYRIPYSYTKSYGNRAVLVGDACGQNKPLTGGGIIFSIRAAQHAASVLNAALEKERYDANFLAQYEKMWKKDIAWEIEKQFLLRLIYRNLTNAEIDELFKNFGPLLTALNGFDYDRLSGLSKSMSKLKLVNFLITKLPRIFHGYTYS